jgi:hypothetical protein
MNARKLMLLPVLRTMISLSYDGYQGRPRYQKPLRKCVLEGCNVMHRHNGGACCSEHHKLWMAGGRLDK